MGFEANTNSQWRQTLQSPVAVLLGGNSAEREISLQSGAAVLSALQANDIQAAAIDIQDENWLEKIEGEFRHSFIALHGGDGEDGTVQGLLDKIGVSYTGSGVAASALAMDKIRCKKLWKELSLPTPEFIEINASSDWQNIIDTFGKVIVKPTCEGSSIGMAIANEAKELASAYQHASVFGESVMAEQWIQGAEFTVAIVGQQALPAIRLETDHGFYDYDAKYLANDTRYICPCGLSDSQQSLLQQLAFQAFDSLGCSGWGRVDFMQDEQGQFYLLELNTVPGMTSHSLVPMAAKAAGMTFESLVTEILRLSIVAA